MSMPDHLAEGLVCFEYDCAELNCMLACWFEFEPAEAGSAFEPSYPAFYSLVHAYLPGSSIDLASALHDSIVEEINQWVYEHARQVVRQMADDAAIDRYENSRDY